METGEMTVVDEATGKTFPVACQLSSRQQKILMAGGLLNATREGLV